MPTFYPEDLDIEVNEFLESCRPGELKEVIEYLEEMGWLKKHGYIPSGRTSVNEQMFNESLSKIKNNWLSLSNEEEDIILNIAKRF